MTTQGERAAAPWKQSQFARQWLESDGMADMLDFPRHLAAAITGLDGTPRTVVDIGSGQGAFLEVFLEQFPSCRGICSDASEAMLAQARQRLARFGDRVEFGVGDMTDLQAAAIPGDVDVIMTSRAVHHLDRDGLFAFYRDCAARLSRDGWLVNLDHTGPVDVWDRRFRAVRPAFVPPRSHSPKHHHTYPLTSVNDHLDAFAAAGITDVEIAWKAFFTCLFMGRKVD